VPISPDALDRWTYRKNGMDYGPFSSKDLCDLITRHEVDGATEVFNLKTRDRRRVEDTPRFADFLKDFLKREAEAKHHAEMMHEVQRLERTMVRSRRLPYALLASAVAVGGVAALLLLRHPAEALAGYPAAFYRDLKFERLPLLKAAEATRAPAVAAAKPDAARPQHHGGGSGGAGGRHGGGVVEVGSTAPIEVDLSYDADEASGGRVLTSDEIQGIQHRVQPGLIRCFRDEAERRPDFRGGMVNVYLMNKGEVRVSKLATEPGPTPELWSCARGAIAGIRVAAFSGASQVLEIPVYVTAAR
jgi:hypothetical protein